MTVHIRDPEIANIYYSWNVSKQLRKIKQKAIEYKGGKCIMCGYNKCPTSMIFHHRKPEDKKFNISNKLAKWDIVKEELDKCDLLCLNCHGETHEVEYKKALLDKEKFIRSKIPERKNKSIDKSICQYCKSEFSLCGRRGNSKYCSVTCRIEAFRKIPNDLDKLQELVCSKTLKELSVDFGVTTRAIQKVCKKNGIFIPKMPKAPSSSLG